MFHSHVQLLCSGRAQTGRSLGLVTYCHHRGGRSPSLRAGGRASVLSPPTGVSSCSCCTCKVQPNKVTILHRRFTIRLILSNSPHSRRMKRICTDLLIPALLPELFPLLPLGEVIRVHGLLRGMPVIQTPFGDLSTETRASGTGSQTTPLNAH